MRRGLVLGLFLGGVLAAALVFAWRSTDADEASGQRATRLEETSPAVSPSAPSPSPEPPPGERPSSPEDEPATPSTPATRAAPAEAASASPPPAPEAPSPFVGEQSRELDYAFELVFGPHSSVESAKSAAEVFERCLKQQPENRRCYDGLVAAQDRQQPGWRPPEPPRPMAVDPQVNPKAPARGLPIDGANGGKRRPEGSEVRSLTPKTPR